MAYWVAAHAYNPAPVLLAAQLHEPCLVPLWWATHELDKAVTGLTTLIGLIPNAQLVKITG